MRSVIYGRRNAKRRFEVSGPEDIYENEEGLFAFPVFMLAFDPVNYILSNMGSGPSNFPQSFTVCPSDICRPTMRKFS